VKIGFNLLLWTTHVTDEHFHLLEKIKAVGYDGVEIPIFEGDVAHFEKVGQALKDNGLDCTSVTVIPTPEHNLLSEDAAHRQSGVDHLKHVLDCSAALGSEVLCGPYYQPLGQFSGNPPTDDEKQRAADAHRQAAEHAQQASVLMTVEYLNRFECYFLNTLTDAAAHVKRVDHPGFQSMYDTFHANIEEKDPVGVISKHIDVIKHVHISANDRGTPGRDHIPYKETFEAFKAAGYDGRYTIEAFGRALPDLAAATCVWRDFFESPEEVYTEGFELIKSLA